MPDSNTPTPTPTPDVSAQPTPVATQAPTTGAPAPIDGAGVQAQMAPFQQKEQAATQRAADLANTPVVPPTVPHARLLSMVQGLATGLSAFGTAIATHGQEGGAKEVQQIRAAQQEQKLQAQSAATAQKNAQIQQQLMIADTNHKLAQNVMLMATLPDEISKSHLTVSGEQQRQAITGADFQAAHGGMTPTEFSNALAGTAPAGSQTGKASFFTINAQQQLGAATKILGEDDPYVKNLQTTLGNPNATPKDIWTATNQVQTQLALQEKTNTAQIQKEQAAAAAPFGDKAADVNAALLKRYQVLNPNVKELPPGYALGPDSTKNDFERIDKIMQQSENAQATQANRQIVNSLREQTLGLAEGKNIPGDTTKTGPDYIASLPPGIRGTITAIGEGREAPPPAGSRSPAAQAVLGALNNAYPNYDATQYPTYAKMRTEFTSGKTAQGINSLNTVATHLARMYDHTTAVSTLPGVSGAARAFGSEQAAALNSDKQAVSTELAKAYANGQISEGEINTWNKKLSVWSPIELKNNIKEIASLLQGKLDAYNNQWKTGMPAGVVAPIQIVGPAAQASFDHISGKQTPQSHVFDSNAWAAANPGKDVNAAIAAAKQQGYEVR